MHIIVLLLQLEIRLTVQNQGSYGSHDLADSLLEDFRNEDIRNVASLKEGYLRVWYEKMALENSCASLKVENSRKDELITQLRQELEQRNGQPPQGQAASALRGTGSQVGQNNVTVSHWVQPGRNFNSRNS